MVVDEDGLNREPTSSPSPKVWLVTLSGYHYQIWILSPCLSPEFRPEAASSCFLDILQSPQWNLSKTNIIPSTPHLTPHVPMSPAKYWASPSTSLQHIQPPIPNIPHLSKFFISHCCYPMPSIRTFGCHFLLMFSILSSPTYSRLISEPHITSSSKTFRRSLLSWWTFSQTQSQVSSSGKYNYTYTKSMLSSVLKDLATAPTSLF